MLVTIHQPNYLPWPGFFHKWLLADALVLLDTVQYSKQDWQNRNRIKTKQGALWLSVPIKADFPCLIQDVALSPKPWARKHIASIEQAYSKAPFFKDYWPDIKYLLQQSWSHLSPMNTALIRCIGAQLGCTAPIYMASDLQTRTTDPSQRLIDLCHELKGDAYLSGSEGRNYLDKTAFQQQGLKLCFQQVKAPVYAQLHPPFIAYLSILDLLFMHGSHAQNIILCMGDQT